MKKIKNIFSNLPKKTIAIIGGVAIVLALGITSTIKSYNEKTHGDYVIASDSVYSKLSGTTDNSVYNDNKSLLTTMYGASACQSDTIYGITQWSCANSTDGGIASDGGDVFMADDSVVCHVYADNTMFCG